MKLINSKSIMKCNENEEELHSQEITKIFELLCEKKKYDCAVLKKYQDPGHKNIEMEVISCNTYELMDVIETCDFKNGVDVYLDDDGFYVFLLYGQLYQLDGNDNMVITALKVMPYDDDRNFFCIS